MMRAVLVRGLTALLLVTGLATLASSQPGGGPTTESFCNFGMAKSEPRQSCEVPIIGGCTVAHFPGTQKPWTNISKGGATTCRFNDKQTDWKTRIIGTCDRCKTEHCSARFSVMFECAASPPTLHSAPAVPPVPR